MKSFAQLVGIDFVPATAPSGSDGAAGDTDYTDYTDQAGNTEQLPLRHGRSVGRAACRTSA